MTDRLRWPDRGGRIALAAAALVWCGIVAPIHIGAALTLAAVVVSVAARRQWPGAGYATRTVAASILVVMGMAAGAVSQWRFTSVVEAGGPSGPLEVVVELEADPVGGRFGSWAIARVVGGHGEPVPTWVPALLSGDLPGSAGQRLAVRGVADARGGSAAGRPYGWRLRVRSAEPVSGGGVLAVGANAARARVASAVAPHADHRGSGLVQGFLIGDESGVSELDRALMREAGLSHFTAVSGSNVALFLIGLWVVLGPLGFGSRRRAVAGLVGLVFFAAITRWEPSVLRACTMAAVVLMARAVGLSMDAWMALGISVAGLTLVDPTLVGQVGFQLSVAAAAGVIMGAGYWRGRILGAALSASIAAHLAVVPVLVTQFGRVPAWGPLLNVIAGPLVAASTLLAALYVVAPVGPAMIAAVSLADVVLTVAEFGSTLPDVGLWTTGFVAAIPFWTWRAARVAVVAIAIVIATAFASDGHSLEPGHVVFFDVGQGDAAAVMTPRGGVILIDGGPEPTVLDQKLTERGIGRIDLLIVSHSHRDHVDGLGAILGRRAVSMVWHSNPADPSGTFSALIGAAADQGIPIEIPRPGDRATLDDAVIDVIGPVRRYASPNDQSLVVRVTLPGGSILFTGDIETYAQADLDPPETDVLKVPHQGAATSDLSWLSAVDADVAVISVGPNTYGHPSSAVIAALEAGGTKVVRTDLNGDVVVDLTGGLASREAARGPG